MKNVNTKRRLQIAGVTLALISCATFSGGRAAHAVATNAQLDSRLTTLEATVISQQAVIKQLTTDLAYVKAHPTPGPAGAKGAQGVAGPQGVSGLTLGQAAILALMIAKGKDLTLVGNLHIVNGLGATNGEPGSPDDTTSPVSNGLGNLIIGYNQARVKDPNVRTGSHNLIVGDYNNYSSVGGMVLGFYGASSAPYATVSGGENNTAAGVFSTIGGGIFNHVDGKNASVSGGGYNFAHGDRSSISGGAGSKAAGEYASVSGGYNNYANGYISSISGGEGVLSNGTLGWAAGGSYELNLGSGVYFYNP